MAANTAHVRPSDAESVRLGSSRMFPTWTVLSDELVSCTSKSLSSPVSSSEVSWPNLVTSSCKRCAFLHFFGGSACETLGAAPSIEGEILVLKVNSLVPEPRFKLRSEAAHTTFVHDLQPEADQGHQFHTRRSRAEVFPALSAAAAAASNDNRSTCLSFGTFSLVTA